MNINLSSTMVRRDLPTIPKGLCWDSYQGWSVEIQYSTYVQSVLLNDVLPPTDDVEEVRKILKQSSENPNFLAGLLILKQQK